MKIEIEIKMLMSSVSQLPIVEANCKFVIYVFHIHILWLEKSKSQGFNISNNIQ